MKTHDEICFAVMACLDKQGIKATYEYPGFIRCETGNGSILAVGGNNEWCGQIWENADQESNGEQGRLIESKEYIGIDRFSASDPQSVADNFIIHTLWIIEFEETVSAYEDNQISITL